MTNAISSAAPPPTLPQTERAKAAADAAKQLKQLNRDMKGDAHEAAGQRLQSLLAQLHSMAALGSKGSAAYTALARKIASAAHALVRTGQAVPAEAKAADDPARPGAETKADTSARDAAKEADRELLRAARTGIGLIKAVIDSEQDDKRRHGLLAQIGNADRAVAAAQSKLAPSVTVRSGGIDISV